jgi:hypothetical protein
MGEQIRIADLARRRAAAVPRNVDIVYTGLRPGEKLSEDLLGQGERDERPYHPLIRHVPVEPLPPEALADLDPACGRAVLRAALAGYARGHAAAAAGPAELLTPGPPVPQQARAAADGDPAGLASIPQAARAAGAGPM